MADINVIMEKQRDFFLTGKTRNVSYRKYHLVRLGQSIKRHEQDIYDALKKDLNKAPFEAYATEVGMVLDELRHVLKHINSWAAPKRVPTPLVSFLSFSRIYSEPYGIALIMSPWNYPFQLTLEPLIGALAAGNCAVVKPSFYSPNTSLIIEEIIHEVFKEEYVTVVQGGRNANQSLLEQKFDYIFFTGSVAVGRTVMEAAAKHLTPVTLELGGKSPCIVDETADIDMAARRIVWGKFLNAGQTCVAPDYLLVSPAVKEELITRMRKYILKFYGSNPCENENYPKIINEKHYNRLLKLMEGENIVYGGKASAATSQIEPTILNHIEWNSRIMQEEIFGPILPVLEYHNLKDIIRMINCRPKPLALYYFTRSRANEKMVIKNISYGGGCINDTVVHLATSRMPFGGVGESGMGGYHGKSSFDTFSHKKSVLKKVNWIDVPLRYPPYKEAVLKMVKLIMK